MVKGVTGVDFKRWIDKVNPSIVNLVAKAKIGRSTFYDYFEKEIVPWSVVHKIHTILSKTYTYDIEDFFPDYDKETTDFVGEKDIEFEENATIRTLRRNNEVLQREVMDLTVKLNSAYEKIVHGYFEKLTESFQNQNDLVKQLIHKNAK